MTADPVDLPDDAENETPAAAEPTPDQLEGISDYKATIVNALTWVQRGFKVFPIAISWDAEADATNKHPLTVNGHLDASDDWEVVRDYFVSLPYQPDEGEVVAAGMIPGSGGYVVLDPDTKHRDEDGNPINGPAYADSIGATDPAAYVVDTASVGGEHRYFAKPGGPGSLYGYSNEIPDEWKNKIDVRGDTGWVVCPGTVTPWGEWKARGPWPENGNGRSNGHIAVLPPAIDKLLRPHGRSTAQSAAASPNGHGHGGSNGAGAGASAGAGVRSAGGRRYQPAVHDDKLDRLTIEAHAILAEFGGVARELTSYRESADHTTGAIIPHLNVTRPDKSGGTSATIGYVGFGVLKVFTSGWPGLRAEGRYDLAKIVSWLAPAGWESTWDTDAPLPGSGWIVDPYAGTPPMAGQIARRRPVQSGAPGLAPEEADAETSSGGLGWAKYRKTGGAFVFDSPAAPEPVWGEGGEVLWSKGEPLLVTGTIGAGKTTMFTGLVRGLLGLEPRLLGYPIAEVPQVLYLACDRPQQIGRNMRRMFDPAERAVLEERLIVWEGPPPRDFGKDESVLLNMAQEFNLPLGSAIFIDSAKDVATKLSDDEVGATVNRNLQQAVREGYQVAMNHHQRKAQGGRNAAKPNSLADVYGSTWLTAGMGTVLCLWADLAGSAFVELSMIKPAAEVVGPLTVYHDILAGSMTIVDHISVYDFLLIRGTSWASINDIAVGTGQDDANRNVRDRIRRKCADLVRAGKAEQDSAQRPGGGKPEAVFRLKVAVR